MPALGRGTWRGPCAFVGTIFVIIALAVLPLLTPLFVHATLGTAGSARLLGMDVAVAHELSDRSVGELVAGPGTFAFAGPDGEPFYDRAERGHLRDARALLWLCLVAGAVSAIIIALLIAMTRGGARSSVWRAISRAGAATGVFVVVAGAVGLVAFEPLFTIFHQVFFPGGGWAFDPTTQRLVQLYPFAFWQIAAASFGLLVLVLAVGAWWLGRVLAARVEDR